MHVKKIWFSNFILETEWRWKLCHAPEKSRVSSLCKTKNIDELSSRNKYEDTKSRDIG